MVRAIELEIGPGSSDGEYTAHVVHSPVGAEPSATVHLDVARLLDERVGLEQAVLLSSRTWRGRRPDERLLQQVGQLLFEALFTHRVMDAYRASVSRVQGQGDDHLRVQLRIAVPELAALPWEAMWDPDTQKYICLDEPLVRHVPAPYTLEEPLEVTPPLRVLGIAASPRGKQLLDVIGEQEQMNTALAPLITAGLLELEWLSQASWAGVHAKLLSSQWHAVHFIGHGDFDVSTNEGLIYLVGAHDRAEPVTADRLATLISVAPRPAPQLVVLNSCSSGEQGSEDLFAGTAATLARSGINAVAAMQFTISEPAAISFATGFYTAVAHGRGIDEAVRNGRIAIAGTPHTLEWVTPVLYLRGENTRLFNMKPVPREQPTPKSTPSPDSQLERHLRAMFIEARAELRQERYEAALTVLNQLLDRQPDYPGAAALRDTVVRELDLADRYQQAVDEQDAGNLTAATELFEQIHDENRSYRDVAKRLQGCRTAGQIADLHADLRHHAETGNWQAVITVTDKLTLVDPNKADFDGLIAHARRMIEDEVVDEEGQHYAQARAAENAGDWKTAIDHYTASVRHSDSKSRLEHCWQQQQIAGIQSQLDRYVRAADWKKVLEIIAELTTRFPSSATSYAGLQARARNELTRSRPQEFRPPTVSTVRKSNGMAITALVVSVVGSIFYGIGSIIGMILGVTALKQLREKPQQKGSGMARAAIWIGVAGIVVWIIVFASAIITTK
ncbi:CHAT domain-containing protein [Nocardia fluminea]|uniref:CHAT domain-containing protein n=1 Tax=Nocardia fluminea TaxID=134984 RepID=UPI003664516A